jgi:molybdopterin-guanine dinucleotide biosynthesis protein B
MHVLAFCGYSGSGKTTLMEQLITRMRGTGLRISVIKHAHHDFDIDQVGKDSWRHRQAGAFEVLVASDRRLALMREYAAPADPSVEALIAELSDCDWVLVEGFRRAPLPKIESWRAATGKAVQYATDPGIIAVATDNVDGLPQPTGLPVLDLNDIDAVVAFVFANADRCKYPRRSPNDARSLPGPELLLAEGARARAGPL